MCVYMYKHSMMYYCILGAVRRLNLILYMLYHDTQLAMRLLCDIAYNSVGMSVLQINLGIFCAGKTV